MHNNYFNAMIKNGQVMSFYLLKVYSLLRNMGKLNIMCKIPKARHSNIIQVNIITPHSHENTISIPVKLYPYFLKINNYV